MLDLLYFAYFAVARLFGVPSWFLTRAGEKL